MCRTGGYQRVSQQEEPTPGYCSRARGFFSSCYQKTSGLAGRTVGYLQRFGAATVYGGSMSFAVNGLMDGMMGLVESIDGLMKNNLSQFGLGVTALLAGAGQGKLIHRQVGTEKTLNMVADFNKAIASLLGGAVGATAATMITQVVAQSLPAYSKAAVFVIGIPLRAVGSFAIGFVATAVFVVAIDGTVAAVNKIREWRQPPPALEPV